MSDLNTWDEVDREEISLEEMDSAVKALQEEWTKVEELKAIAKEAREKYDIQELKVLDMLKRSKKSKYQVDGVGTVYITNRYVTRIPKDLDSKQKLFNWIRDTKGSDILLGMVSINSQTLNAFVNAERDTNPTVEIPGVGAPTHEESIGFRTERKK